MEYQEMPLSNQIQKSMAYMTLKKQKKKIQRKNKIAYQMIRTTCKVLFLCGFSSLILANFSGNIRASGDECLKCHQITTPKVSKEYGNSIHAVAALSCSSCHGGNPTATSKEAAHSKEHQFKGKLEPLDSLKACSDCHSDIEKMKVYRLNANIANEYFTSQHGKLLKKSDKNVPTCATCHGSHLIIRKKDPQSPTNRKNIPKTCSKCHADTKLMSLYNIPADQVAEYIDGVHGQILYGKRHGDPNLVPTCYDCHGNHGAMPPEVTKIHYICGTCHFVEQKYYLQSAHGNHENSGPLCITCHGNHKNSIPVEGLFISEQKGGCNNCHSNQDENSYKVATTFSKVLQDGKKVLNNFEGLTTTVLQNEVKYIVKAEYDKAKLQFSKLRAIMHSLSEEKTADVFKELESSYKSTLFYIEKSKEKEEDGFSWIIIGGSIAVGLLILLSFFISYLLLRLIKNRKNSKEL
ncbi:MAG: hypothetical protein HY606_14710 [Planctomycetes bacterium]|nr:hypothetical protein [Planctomycetota bacterium]